MRERIVLANAGYELTRSVFAPAELETLALSASGAGVRSLLDVEAVRTFARDPRLLALAGSGAFAVRAILFDKSSEANWALGWHQDSSVAVGERVEVDGFGPWTTKDGVPHAIAPVSLLESMVSLRVHLDDCGEENGPLRVIAGSHALGRLSAEQISAHVDQISRRVGWGDRSAVTTCLASRGDVLAFKPLLLHASSSARVVSHRRVLQLEYAFGPLPAPLRWRWS
ncbi:MAG: phytanoyl-CoA dioxygenase family protein [Archangium sp.]|nr:phytanoyl-CoA dioxygenase family protein [Archangium sp.]